LETDEGTSISLGELRLALRNHGMPLEALRYDVTPVGLHYLLTHYDIPLVDPAGWRLSVGGLVERELELSLDDLRARPSLEVAVTMECAGNGRVALEPRPYSQPWISEAVGTAKWRGVPLRSVLEEAGIADGTLEVVFTALDRGIEDGIEQDFARSLTLEEASREEVLLAYELNGIPLPPQHGFPLRLIVPGWYGMTNVKWLTRIELVDEPFTGHQQSWSYRLRQQADEEGIPLDRMRPRALMVPPGTPDFPTRARTLPLEPSRLEGRAWSGVAPVEAVEVSVDGGETWAAAELDEPVGDWAWRGWSFLWSPGEAGTYELLCRARDAAGNEQPAEPEWNLGGYGNNAAQHVSVSVVAG
jgi:sulfane dehydrogenase subunit SoxC